MDEHTKVILKLKKREPKLVKQLIPLINRDYEVLNTKIKELEEIGETMAHFLDWKVAPFLKEILEDGTVPPYLKEKAREILDYNKEAGMAE